jgi:hypothetical protein
MLGFESKTVDYGGDGKEKIFFRADYWLFE